VVPLVLPSTSEEPSKAVCLSSPPPFSGLPLASLPSFGPSPPPFGFPSPFVPGSFPLPFSYFTFPVFLPPTFVGISLDPLRSWDLPPPFSWLPVVRTFRCSIPPSSFPLDRFLLTVAPATHLCLYVSRHPSYSASPYRALSLMVIDHLPSSLLFH
jgi:hypothetical protein